MKRTLFVFVPLIFIIGAGVLAHAETKYVSDLKSITLRTGQGTKHKILMMVKSGQPVEILEEGEEWTRVRLQNGKEGWVMGRFLTSEKPCGLVLEALKKKYEWLKSQSEELGQANNQLKQDDRRISDELEKKQKLLAETTHSFETLKNESADFFELKKKYTKTTAQLEDLTKQFEAYKKIKINEWIMAAVTGVGILFFGYILGSISKKRKRRSSLL